MTLTTIIIISTLANEVWAVESSVFLNNSSMTLKKLGPL